jgi:hypothetical protein
MKEYSREAFDNINSYRNEMLDYLKSTNNHFFGHNFICVPE